MSAEQRINQYLHKRAGLRGYDDYIHGIDAGDLSSGFLRVSDIERVLRQRAELLEALKSLMYWENGKSEWVAAQELINKVENQ